MVESMNIVTIDMLPEDQMPRHGNIESSSGMKIVEASGCVGCTDCLAGRDDKNLDNEEIKSTPQVQ